MHPLKLFFILIRHFIVRNMRRHPWRALAVLMGVALGAGVFTSVRLAANASVDAFSESMDLISGSADWVAARPGGRVPEDLVARLQKDPAVRHASPLLTSYVQVAGRPNSAFMLIGMDPILDFPLRQWDVSLSSPQSQQV